MEPSQTSQTHMVGKTAHEPKRRMLKPSAGFVNMVMIVFAGGPADMNEVLVSVQFMNRSPVIHMDFAIQAMPA